MDGEIGLGKGVNAIFGDKVDSSVQVEPEATKIKTTPKKEVESDMEIKRRVLEKAITNPRAMLYSEIGSAVLNYFRETTPKFSMSAEASRLVESAIQQEYPELYNEFKAMIDEQRIEE